MALILCIDTSSTNCSVALSSDQMNSSKFCLDVLEDNGKQYSHGELLHVYIDEILKRNDLNPSDLSAIAVSKGPGSYTGLRIGVASAKGLCYSLDIPLIAIDTLTALSKHYESPIDFKIPIVDARRMEVYAAVLKGDVCVEQPHAHVLTEQSFKPYLDQGSCVFIGSGAEKFSEIMKHKNAFYIKDAMPSASTMCALAMNAYKKSDTVNVAYFEPMYLKEFKAG